MLTDERKQSIVQEIEYIFSIINNRSNKRTSNASNLDDDVMEDDENENDINHTSVS